MPGRHFARSPLPANPSRPSSIAPSGAMQQRAEAVAATALAPIARTWGLALLTVELAFQMFEQRTFIPFGMGVAFFGQSRQCATHLSQRPDARLDVGDFLCARERTSAHEVRRFARKVSKSLTS